MDSISLTYGSLFSIQLLHNGYNLFQQNLIGENITIRPDKDTQKLFDNHGVRYSFNNGTLVCSMRSRLMAPPALTPVMSYIEFDGNVRLRFLVFSSTGFLDKTQAIAAGKTQVYHFTNQANVGTNGFIAQQETGVNNADLDTTAVVQPSENCFAVIDIHNNGAVNAAYDLFGGDKRFLSPQYRIRFTPKP